MNPVNELLEIRYICFTILKSIQVLQNPNDKYIYYFHKDHMLDMEIYIKFKSISKYNTKAFSDRNIAILIYKCFNQLSYYRTCIRSSKIPKDYIETIYNKSTIHINNTFNNNIDNCILNLCQTDDEDTINTEFKIDILESIDDTHNTPIDIEYILNNF